MKLSIEELIAKLEKAATVQAQYKEVWQDIYDLTMPQRMGFYETTVGQRRDYNIFDETGVVGTEEFANRVQSGLFPDYMDWMNLKVGPENEDDDTVDEAQEKMDRINKIVFSEIHASNFYTVVNENLRDLMLGFTTMQFDDSKVDGFTFRTIEQPSCYMVNGPDGRTGMLLINRKVRADQVHVLYPKAELSSEIKKQFADKPAEIVHVVDIVHRDYEATRQETWEYQVVLVKEKAKIFETTFKGQGSNPFISAKWSTIAGEDYGRGPAYNALAAMKTANLTVQLILENAEISIAGIWQAEDDGVVPIENIRLVPGTIIPYAQGSRGLQPLAAGGDFDVGQLILQDMRHNIRKAMYNETLGPREGTPASATEISERMGDLARLMGPNLGRLIRELAIPVYLRAIYLLKKRGKIEKLPRIDGKRLKLHAVSPLATAQKNSDIGKMNGFLSQIATHYGPQGVAAIAKPIEIGHYLADKWDIPKKLINSAADVKKQAAEIGGAVGKANAEGVDAGAIMDKIAP